MHKALHTVNSLFSPPPRGLIVSQHLKGGLKREGDAKLRGEDLINIL